MKNEEATATRLELMGRLEVLREEMNKLEQQYEKTKPLVNLVDNMVKLGSLYRAGSIQWDANSMRSGMTLQRLRGNQKELERRLQQDDQKQWNKFDPTQIELQVSQLQFLQFLMSFFKSSISSIQSFSGTFKFVNILIYNYIIFPFKSEQSSAAIRVGSAITRGIESPTNAATRQGRN